MTNATTAATFGKGPDAFGLGFASASLWWWSFGRCSMAVLILITMNATSGILTKKHSVLAFASAVLGLPFLLQALSPALAVDWQAQP